MLIKYAAGDIKNLAFPSLVLFVGQYDKISDRRLKSLDEASSGAVASMLKSGEFAGKNGEIASVFRPNGYMCSRVILVGLGERKKITADSYRRAAGSVSRYKGLTTSEKAAFYFDKSDKDDFFQAAAEGYLLGSYKLRDFKTGESKKDTDLLGEITFAVDQQGSLNRLKKATQRGLILSLIHI